MDYWPRKGIVFLKICDANLLVPLREASEVCHEITSISIFESIVWKKLEKGDDLSELPTLFSKLSSIPEKEIKARIDAFLKKLYEKGFLVSSVDTAFANEAPIFR